ncbi:MAG: hypothetical protein KatS3mg028_0352 [Bacteroidia bacterium]|nr:MAG: hypothetical protein KatS3mg028_0352 [Bacteroidia bacterium]
MIQFLLKYKLTLIGLVLGGIGGFVYYKQIGCISGACPITSNPYISTLYGMLLGALLTNSFEK